MTVRVFETHLASRQADALRGAARQAYQAFLDDLAAEGCAAMGYRLTGPDPLPRLCAKHLRGQDRVIVAFSAPDEAWVVLIGTHTTDPGRNVYDQLYQLAGVSPPDQASRTKPPCCGETDGRTPMVPPGDLDELVAGARHLASRRHRARTRVAAQMPR